MWAAFHPSWYMVRTRRGPRPYPRQGHRESYHRTARRKCHLGILTPDQCSGDRGQPWPEENPQSPRARLINSQTGSDYLHHDYDGKTAQDLLLAPYPEAAMAILTQHNIQMKHPPPTSDPSEHCRVAGSSMDKVVQGQDGGMGVGHSN